MFSLLRDWALHAFLEVSAQRRLRCNNSYPANAVLPFHWSRIARPTALWTLRRANSWAGASFTANIYISSISAVRIMCLSLVSNSGHVHNRATVRILPKWSALAATMVLLESAEASEL